MKGTNVMKILIVIDMQKDFTTGVLGNPETAAAAGIAAEKIRAYRSEGNGVPVIFTMDTHGEDYLETQEGKKLPIVHCVKNTDGWEIDPSVRAAAERTDIILEKNSFGSLKLPKVIKETAADKFSEIDSIELIGVCTDICVISNAMILKAAFPDIPIIVDGNCCAGVTPESHDNALKAMASCQIEVL